MLLRRYWCDTGVILMRYPSDIQVGIVRNGSLSMLLVEVLRTHAASSAPFDFAQETAIAKTHRNRLRNEKRKKRRSPERRVSLRPQLAADGRSVRGAIAKGDGFRVILRVQSLRVHDGAIAVARELARHPLRLELLCRREREQEPALRPSVVRGPHGHPMVDHLEAPPAPARCPDLGHHALPPLLHINHRKMTQSIACHLDRSPLYALAIRHRHGHASPKLWSACSPSCRPAIRGVIAVAVGGRWSFPLDGDRRKQPP